MAGSLLQRNKSVDDGVGLVEKLDLQLQLFLQQKLLT